MAGLAALTMTPIAGPLGSSGEGDEDREEKCCVVPVGWKRELVRSGSDPGRIVYVSPTHCLLWSHQDVLTYLTMDGTCKCGLSCPLHVDKVFNFDPAHCLQSDASLSDSDANQNTLCNHRRKLQALAHYQSMLKANSNQLQHSANMLQLHQQHQQQHLLHQPQHQLQHHSPERLDHRPNLRQPLETRSFHLNPHIQNQHQHMNLHDASQQQHLVVNPSEVNGREFVTGFVNGNDTQVQRQDHQHAQHPHHNHLQHLSHTPPESRQLHDVTAVTASITELIPSVGQLMPHMQIQQAHPAHVQYSLILPQQILTMQPSPDQQMLLSPQIVSSFTHSNHAINAHFHPHHQPHQPHHFEHQLLFGASANTADMMKQKARRKRSNKKVRTVAAILNLTT